MREGDLDNRQVSGMQVQAMRLGSRMHRKLQKKAGPMYHAEVPLKLELEEEHYTIVLEGRADGIIQNEDAGEVIIDEIKGVFFDIHTMEEPLKLHLAQAKCYAFIYALQNKCKAIGVRMTYVNLDTEQLRYFHIKYEFEELEAWFLGLIRE